MKSLSVLRSTVIVLVSFLPTTTYGIRAIERDEPAEEKAKASWIKVTYPEKEQKVKGAQTGTGTETELTGCDRSSADFDLYARSLWRSMEPDCYEYQYSRSCRCLEEVRGPYQVRVEKGEIVSLDPTLPDDAFPGAKPLTMPELFKLVRRQCVNTCRKETRGADDCVVTYNDTYGYIEYLYIDYQAMRADEEFIVTISDFKPC